MKPLSDEMVEQRVKQAIEKFGVEAHSMGTHG